MGHFKDLKAWQHARRLAVLSKHLMVRLPSTEQNALIDQWRRACYSVVLNIAEGASKRGSREFRKYLDTARASLHEVEAILDLCVALGYLTGEEIREVEGARAECAKTVYGLLRKFGGTGTPAS